MPMPRAFILAIWILQVATSLHEDFLMHLWHYFGSFQTGLLYYEPEWKTRWQLVLGHPATTWRLFAVAAHATVCVHRQESADDSLFQRILANYNHILSSLMPPKSDNRYNLRNKHLDRGILEFNCNFIVLFVCSTKSATGRQSHLSPPNVL